MSVQLPGPTLPFVAGNQRIGLITNAEIRYEGYLHEIQPEQNTVALKNVRMMGTEGRLVGKQIAPSNVEYGYIVFKGNDIKDLTLHDEELPPELPPDPAIASATESFPVPTAQQQKPLPPTSVLPEHPLRQQTAPPAQPSATTSLKPRTSAPSPKKWQAVSPSTATPTTTPAAPSHPPRTSTAPAPAPAAAPAPAPAPAAAPVDTSSARRDPWGKSDFYDKPSNNRFASIRPHKYAGAISHPMPDGPGRDRYPPRPHTSAGDGYPQRSRGDWKSRGGRGGRGGGKQDYDYHGGPRGGGRYGGPRGGRHIYNSVNGGSLLTRGAANASAGEFDFAAMETIDKTELEKELRERERVTNENPVNTYAPKDFFDNLSCDTTKEGERERQNQTHKDMETFGPRAVSALHRHDGQRGGGRGRFRGGGRRGRY